MCVIYHPESRTELIEAAVFREQRVAGLGADFLTTVVDMAVVEIAANPERGPILEGDVRRSRVKRFPYSICYRCIGDEIRILAVSHHSRDPDYWKHRR